MPTTGELFAKSKGAPIEVGSTTVEMMLALRVDPGSKLRIVFGEARREPPQGLRVKIDSGYLEVNAQQLKDVVLWEDSAPDVVEVVPAIRQAATVKIWNVWQDSSGAMQAWIGNSGMVIDRQSRTTTIRCSDGTDGFDPSALLASIEIAEPGG